MEYGQVENLEDLNNGIIRDLFPDAIADVLQNIGDENTAAAAKRRITIEITFAPSKDREMVGTSVEVKTKLAPPAISESILMLSSDGNETTAHYRKDEPEQEKLDLEFPQRGVK